MKNIFLLIFTIVISTNINAQHAIAKISYGVTLHLDRNTQTYKIHEEFRPGVVSKAESVASEIDFALIFNNSFSIFYLEDKLFSDNRAAEFAIRNTKYFGRIKQQSQNYITEELQESFGKFLVARPYQKWQKHDETKVIGDYTCFKATTSYIITNSKGKKFKHEFTAWYTPQLPYKFGPAGYGNLPGLIIELQGRDFSYGVKKIRFFDKGEKSKRNVMPKLKRKKLISEEEFKKLAAKDEKRWRNNN